MRVMYDYQIFSLQKVGGISRYFYELIHGSQAFYESSVAIKYHKNIYLEQLYKPESLPWAQKKHHFLVKEIIRFIRKKFGLLKKPVELNQIHVIEKLSTLKPDIFHPTYYSDYYVEHLQDTPFVLTIYDMTHELFPEYLQDERIRHLKRKLYRLATRVIAISESTKKDIIDLYEDSGDKISVVHLANSIDGRPQRKINGVPGKYLLFVGQRAGYKNFTFFLRSVAEMLKQDDGLHVVCTGPPFTISEQEYFESLGISFQVHHYFAMEEELAYLYGRAEMLVFPSLYEGFGIPVLEAFGCGCPVLLSNSSSLPEVGGDAAVYFEPTSPIELREAVGRVLTDLAFKRDLISKGYERVKEFSWQSTIKETENVYRACL